MENKNSKTTVYTIPYTRVDHFSKLIDDLNPDDDGIVPDDIYDIIINRMSKESIDPTNVSLSCLKKIMKMEGLYKYYEYVLKIHHKLTGYQYPCINDNLKTQLIDLFKQFIQSNEKIIKIHFPERNSMIPYNFILFKLLQLLKMNGMFSYIHIYDNDYKLGIYDNFWKYICEDIGWKYEPTKKDGKLILHYGNYIKPAKKINL